MLSTGYARVAQLVEHDLAKVGAAGSSPVSRSLKEMGKSYLRLSCFLECWKLTDIAVDMI